MTHQKQRFVPADQIAQLQTLRKILEFLGAEVDTDPAQRENANSGPRTQTNQPQETLALGESNE